MISPIELPKTKHTILVHIYLFQYLGQGTLLSFDHGLKRDANLKDQNSDLAHTVPILPYSLSKDFLLL